MEPDPSDLNDRMTDQQERAIVFACGFGFALCFVVAGLVVFCVVC